MTLQLGTDTLAILLDIEGTTTPVSFVYEALFPYARTHLSSWMDAHGDSDDGRKIASMLAAEWAADRDRGEPIPAWTEQTSSERAVSVVRYAEWLMERDRKSPGLKLLQGLIWEKGYRAGELRGQVFPDVPTALGRWARARMDIAIYSSGSVLAQKLLFGSNNECDLTPLIKAYFDTAVGPKTSRESYRRIAEEMERPAHTILFISDVAAELTAAAAAGFRIALSVRPGNAPQTIDDSVPRVTRLDEIPFAPANDIEQARQRRARPLLWWCVALVVLNLSQITLSPDSYRIPRAAVTVLLMIGFYWVPPLAEIGFIGYALGVLGLIGASFVGPSWLGRWMPKPVAHGLCGAVLMWAAFELATPKFGRRQRYWWIIALMGGALAAGFSSLPD